MPSKPILVVFLHGIGASGAQLMPLASSWGNGLPSAQFAAPDALFNSSWGTGHIWFRVDGSELQPDRISTIRKAFDKVVADVISRHGFSNELDRVAFVGVSQGAIMGLDAVANGRWKVGAVVSFSGLLAPVPIMATDKSTSILVVHGQDDKTIPAAASTVAAAQLKAAGFKVELDLMPNVGHTVSPEGAEIALRFLKDSFAS